MTHARSGVSLARLLPWTLAALSLLSIVVGPRRAPAATPKKNAPVNHAAAPAAARKSGKDPAKAPAPALVAPEDLKAKPGVTHRFKSAVQADQSGRPMSLSQAYPGFHPEKFDPDLADVKRGRRRVAKNDIPLTEGGKGAMKALIENAINCAAIGSGKLLAEASVSYQDFARICWPEFPQSRPAAQVPLLSAWQVLHHKNVSAFNRACGEWHDKGPALKEFTYGTVTDYTNFRIYNDVQVTVTDAATGEPRDFTMIRTILEREGVFKIYGTRD